MRARSFYVAAACFLVQPVAALAQADQTALGALLAEKVCGAEAAFTMDDAQAAEYAGPAFSGIFTNQGAQFLQFTRAADGTANCYSRTQGEVGGQIVPRCRDAAVSRSGDQLFLGPWLARSCT